MRFDNVFVCYSTQNYLKALHLAFRGYENGESSKILVLTCATDSRLRLVRPDLVFWAHVEHEVHDNRFVRITGRDRRRPHALLGKTLHKVGIRARRGLLRRAQLRRVLDHVDEGGRVFLFLERNYFSDRILARRRCTLVEEGISSYLPHRGDGEKKGHHPNVDAVLLRDPDRARGVVPEKIRPLELDYQSLPVRVRSALLSLFGLGEFQRAEDSALIVGQAWSCSSVPVRHAVELYRAWIAALRDRGRSVWFKPHPNESRRAYADLDCELLDPTIPIEVFDLIEDGPAFGQAFSALRSSVAMSRQLAEHVACVVDEDMVVEDLQRADFDRIRAQSPDFSGRS